MQSVTVAILQYKTCLPLTLNVNSWCPLTNDIGSIFEIDILSVVGRNIWFGIGQISYIMTIMFHTITDKCRMFAHFMKP